MTDPMLKALQAHVAEKEPISPERQIERLTDDLIKTRGWLIETREWVIDLEKRIKELEKAKRTTGNEHKLD